MATPKQAIDSSIQAEQAVNAAFAPHAPISAATLFRGRKDQIREVVDTITSEGLHAVIYGERGVGKTSLANILNDYLGAGVSVTKVICGQNDTFSAIVRRALGPVTLAARQQPLGFVASEHLVPFGLLGELPTKGDLAPDIVATLLSRLPLHLVVVVDEFDRLPVAQTAEFADLIKALSDRGAASTLVLVGVAEDVTHLLASHASVSRNLRQIHLPRMSEPEIVEIIDGGLQRAHFAPVADDPRARIVSVSQGFPHYAHLLTQYACRESLDAGRFQISDADVLAGMAKAVERADQSHRDSYHKATTGARVRNIWREVVVSCSLAETDERGYFSLRAATDQVAGLVSRAITTQTVAPFLTGLLQPDRGPLLERTGPQRRYRYRFVNPLMRPFILMKAMNDGLITAPPLNPPR